jgi:hypothetical protein
LEPRAAPAYNFRQSYSRLLCREKKNKNSIVYAGSLPKPPQSHWKEKMREKKRRARGLSHMHFGAFPHHLLAMTAGKGKAILSST